MNIYTVVLVINFLCHCHHGLILKHGMTADAISTKLADAILHISELRIDSGKLVIMSLPRNGASSTFINSADMILEKISQSYSVIVEQNQPLFNVLKRNHKTKPKHFIRAGVHILFMEQPAQEQPEIIHFEAEMSKKKESFLIDPTALFILTMPSKQCGMYDNRSFSARYFSILWKLNCWRTALLVLSECDQTLTVVSGKPFTPLIPCRSVRPEGLQQGVFSSAQDYSLNMYNASDLHDLRGCRFSAATTISAPYVIGKVVNVGNKTYSKIVGGIDIELVGMLSRRYNFTYGIKIMGNGFKSWFDKIESGTVGNISRNIKLHNIDFAVGGFYPYFDGFIGFYISHPYLSVEIAIFVRDPKPFPKWLTVFKVLSPGLWTVLFIVFVVVYILYCTMDRFRKPLKKLRPRKHLSKEKIFFEFFRLTLGFPSVLKPDSSHLKLLFVFWLIHSIYINDFYTSAFTDLETQRSMEKIIQTLDDLKSSGLKVASPKILVDVFKSMNDADEIARYIANNHIACPIFAHCLNMFFKNKTFGILVESDQFEFYYNLREEKVHRIWKNVLSYGVCLKTNEGNPLAKIFHDSVARVAETGLIMKWAKKSWLKISLQRGLRDALHEKRTSLIILDDLKGPFYIFLIGIAISVLVFIGECGLYFFKKSFNSKI